MTHSLIPFIMVTAVTLGLLELFAKVYRWNRSYTSVLRSRLFDLAFVHRAQPEASIFRNASRWTVGFQQIRRGRGWLQRLVDQAAVSISPRSVIGYSVAVGAICFTAVAISLPWQVLLVTPLTTCLPVLILLQRRRTRRSKLTKQLPSVFRTMSRTIRAGHTIRGAMQNIADTFDNPVAQEFALCCDQQSLGASRDQTLRELGDRTQIAELKLFAIAILIQSHTGGDVIRLFDNLAEMVRKRQRFQDRVRTLTGEARMQAIVLIVLPVIAFIGLQRIAPDYVEILIQRPSILFGAAIAQLVGGLWIYKIIRIDV